MSDSDNPVSDASSPLDLRFLPSWLKEENSSAANYANFEGEAPRRERRDGGSDFRRSPRPGQSTGGRDSRGPQRPAGDQRNQGNAGAPRSAQGGLRPENRGPQGSRPARPDQKGRHSGPPDRRQNQRPPQPEERPARVNISFLPEIHALEKVTEQLKSAPIAYPLFGVAKMFLQRPERHHVVIKPLPEGKLFVLKNTSHLATDRTRLESIAFQELWKQFFRVEITEAPEIKGNFTSVGRSRLTGKIFGPTSHHSFQPALHKEYEERFSRRMSFQEYRSNIETTNNPEAVEQWKTESRRLEVYHLLSPEELAEMNASEKEAAPDEVPAETVLEATPEAEPTALESEAEVGNVEATELEATGDSVETDAAPADEILPTADIDEPVNGVEAGDAPLVTAGQSFPTRSEAEAYFHKEILPTVLLEVDSETITGQQARDLGDRRLTTSVRLAWEAEMRYPLGLVNAIRVKFNQQNLHIFKFKKRVLLISSLKPAYLDDKSESLSGSIRVVLQTIHAHSGIDRKGLAEKILGHNVGATEDEKLSLKHSLIGDLYWLIRQGHVIEFSDGTFDLPMGPKALQAEAAQNAKTLPKELSVASAPAEFEAEQMSPENQEQ